MAKKDVRDLIVAWAHWAVKNRKRFHYKQARPAEMLVLPVMYLDCSSFVAWLYRRAGAHDPNRRGYSGIGNTQTLAAMGKKIPKVLARGGDVVIYNVDLPLSTQHTALVIKGGLNPMTVSLGQEGDPSFVRVSQDPRKATFYRFPTDQGWPSEEVPAA